MFPRTLLVALGWPLCIHASPVELKPVKEQSIAYTPQQEKAFNSPESVRRCDSIWNLPSREVVRGKRHDEILALCDETRESIWQSHGGGCSWYCGGGPVKIVASSSLKPSAKIDYKVENLEDLDYSTVWAEGSPGDGVGEWVEFEFEANSPRINAIVVGNGYLKSEKQWKANSRVKTLNVSVNGKERFVLRLSDTRTSQRFQVPLLGRFDDKNWKLRFTVQEIYPGERYQDVVISEIHFDGVDVH